MNVILKYFKDHWFALLLLFLGLHISVFQLQGYNFKNIIGDLGDSRFIISIVEYNYQWAIGNYDHYWDGFFMFPDKEVISYSDNLLGITPFYAPFRLLGFSVLTSFQLLIILSNSLNFIFCYFCFRKTQDNRYAAASGAFVFAFSIALSAISNHPQYAFRFFIPLFFYYLFKYLNTLEKRSLCFAFIMLSFQFYLGIYLGYFLSIAGVLFFASYFLFNTPRFVYVKKHFIPLLIITPVFLLSLVPLFYFYYKRNQITGYYTDYEYYMQTLPRLSSYVRSFPGSLLWNKLSTTEVHSHYPWFHHLFPGALVLISLGTAIYFAAKRQTLYLALVVTLFILILFTTNYNGHTLYGYLMKIPGIKAARVVSRIVTVLIFFAGWLVCLNIGSLMKYFKYQKLVIVIIPIFLVLDNYSYPEAFRTYSKLNAEERISDLKKKIQKTPNPYHVRNFAYIPEKKDDTGLIQLDAMLCALEMNYKTVNGYSSSCHRDFGPFWKNPDSTTLAGWCTAMNLPLDSVLTVK